GRPSGEQLRRKRRDRTAINAALQRVFGNDEPATRIGLAPDADALRPVPFQLSAPPRNVLRLAHQAAMLPEPGLPSLLDGEVGKAPAAPAVRERLLEAVADQLLLLEI